MTERWISEKQELPAPTYNTGKRVCSNGVLISYDTCRKNKIRRVMLAHVEYNGKDHSEWRWVAHDRIGTWLEKTDVTHWQPLPDPPMDS